MHTRLLFALPALLAFTACGEDEVSCTTEAVGSVNVVVNGPDGNPATDATVTYTVDGGASAACDANPDDTWTCGWEQSGEIAVTASGPNLGAQTQTVTVEAGECHVTPESLAFDLTAECLDDAIVYAVAVTLVGASGEVLTDPLVTWTPQDDSGLGPTGCDQIGDAWMCALEYTGPLQISGTAGGHTTATADLDIPSDGCHPVPAEITLTVDWLPD